MSTHTLKTWVSAGALIRGRLKSAILVYCWEHDITCNITEDKGWFNSVYYLHLSGTQDALETFQRWVSEIERLNSSTDQPQ